MPKIKTKYATVETGYQAKDLSVSVEFINGALSIQIILPDERGMTTIDFRASDAKKLADAIDRALKEAK